MNAFYIIRYLSIDIKYKNIKTGTCIQKNKYVKEINKYYHTFQIFMTSDTKKVQYCWLRNKILLKQSRDKI